MRSSRMAWLMAVLLVVSTACGERGEMDNDDDEGAAAEAAEVATPLAAPGEEAVLVEEGEGLLARAQITDQAARVTALVAVSGGRIAKAVLEEEDGRLVYSYDLVVEGQDGITEVLIDATTGAVVSTEHEAATEG